MSCNGVLNELDFEFDLKYRKIRTIVTNEMVNKTNDMIEEINYLARN